MALTHLPESSGDVHSTEAFWPGFACASLALPQYHCDIARYLFMTQTLTAVVVLNPAANLRGLLARPNTMKKFPGLHELSAGTSSRGSTTRRGPAGLRCILMWS